jgi:hypothetical protein
METMSKRSIGRHETCWEDDVLEDIKSMNISNWKKVAQNRDNFYSFSMHPGNTLL